MGSSKDSIKCYCEFEVEEIKTCVKVRKNINRGLVLMILLLSGINSNND